MEYSGSILVNERGIVDGNPLVIHPHPNFRMFLTVNPSYGEVSRAMRNRGVEIFVMQSYWALEDVSGTNYADTELNDVKRCLILSGIPGAQLVNSIARAHIFAKNEGLRFNVHITHLELSRWVHLFQQLLLNGCSPIWSLQISWEHIYLSSLGEVEGGKIINFAKTAYLSVADLFGYDTLVASPLCLPGGWPMPLTLRDYVYYSKETSVKQNSIYLEFLGAQLASYQYQAEQNKISTNHRPYLVDMRVLYETLFPKASNVIISNCKSETELDLELTNKMLSFAANWTIEQATESDFKLYLLRFDWFSLQLQPFCQFFQYFLRLMEQVIKHPIWKYVSCRGQLSSDLQSLPLLSLELYDLAESNSTCKYLCNAISCVDLLRLTYQQWDIESKHDFTDEVESFKSFLKSLGELEYEFLSKVAGPPIMIVECSSFDDLIQLYSSLIEDHIQLWRHFSKSKFDQLIISWRSLVKVARKLLDICPKHVDKFLVR